MHLLGIEITFRPTRVYVLGRRVHHGLLGLVLVLLDRHDWRVWVTDFLRHPGWR